MLTSVMLGRGDRHQAALEVGAPVLAALPADRALGRVLGQLGDRVGRDQGDVGAARQQALDLLQPHLAAADDEAAAPLEQQAGDVQRSVEQPPHAGLVADPLAELAHAFLALVGLCRHGLSQGSQTYTSRMPETASATATTI